MIECIDNVRTKIETVKNKTDNSINDEVEMNEYLDAILVVRKKMDELAIEIENLVEDLYDFFENNHTPETYLKLKPDLESLYRVASEVDAHARKRFYNGAQESIENYCSSVAYVKELIGDMELTFIKLPTNPRFNEVKMKLKEMTA